MILDVILMIPTCSRELQHVNVKEQPQHGKSQWIQVKE